MLDFAHDDRLFPRPAPQAEASRTNRRRVAADSGDRVARIKAQVAAGTYLSDAKLDKALDRMIAAAKR